MIVAYNDNYDFNIRVSAIPVPELHTFANKINHFK